MGTWVAPPFWLLWTILPCRYLGDPALGLCPGVELLLFWFCLFKSFVVFHLTDKWRKPEQSSCSWSVLCSKLSVWKLFWTFLWVLGAFLCQWEPHLGAQCSPSEADHKTSQKCPHERRALVHTPVIQATGCELEDHVLRPTDGDSSWDLISKIMRTTMD
jgi:hypothetical protein